MKNIISEVKKIFAKSLKIPIKEINNNLSYVRSEKWDSVNHMNLILELERRFNIILDENDVIKIKDYKSCHKLIKNKLND